MISIAINPTTDEAARNKPQHIKNNGFWPDLDLQHYRDTMRQDSTLTPARLREAAQFALNETHHRLAQWQKKNNKRVIPPWLRLPASAWAIRDLARASPRHHCTDLTLRVMHPLRALPQGKK